MQSPLIIWLVANSSWLGWPFMVLTGGAVAYVQAYEASEIHWSVPQHVRCLISCWLKATLVGALIFYVQQSFKLDLPLCFVATGLLSVFASDALKKLYDLAMKWIFFKASPPAKDPDERSK